MQSPAAPPPKRRRRRQARSEEDEEEDDEDVVVIVDDDDDIEDLPAAAAASAGSTPSSVPMTATPSEVEAFRDAMLAWYDAHRRNFSWRTPGTSAYGVWVSEVMSQQTRVDTVEKYWPKFMAHFPDPASLAGASIDEVNEFWAGLGYYRRASLLHEGAKQVVKDFAGALPGTAKELLTIKGIGPYTSGAVASIAFAEPVPAVDGNVIRVLSRWRAYDEFHVKSSQLVKAVTALASELVAARGGTRPGDFNQSIMELGATVCTPRAPSCSSCPVQATCRAKATIRSASDIAARFPRPPPAGKKPVPRIPVLIALVVAPDQHVLSVRRPETGGLLSGQWELCVCEDLGDGEDLGKAVSTRLAQLGVCSSCVAPSQVKELGRFTHTFSHLKHECVVARVPFVGTTSCACVSAFKWVKPGSSRHGLTRAMTKALEFLVQ